MSRVKIFLEPGETVQDAEDSFLKAMDLHNSGDIHSSHRFQDPAMIDISEKMENLHSKMYQEMLVEIFQALDEDYKK